MLILKLKKFQDYKINMLLHQQQLPMQTYRLNFSIWNISPFKRPTILLRLP